MAGKVVGLLLVFALLSLPAHAVEQVYTGTFNESDPNITNWMSTSYWPQAFPEPSGYTNTTGWNYVGSVSGSMAQASGVYLGNGWVITCAHVGPGSFKLNSVTYPYVANSVQNFYSTGTTTTQVDFILFRVSSPPNLPTLSLRRTDPVVGSSQVAMLGYGDGGSLTNETWGNDTVNYAVNQSTNVNGYITNDFWVENNSSSAKYQVESGDSGGGDFIQNSTTGFWELAGLNEAILQNESGQDAGSAFVQLDTYAAQILLFINPAIDTPTLPEWGLMALGGLLMLAAIPPILLERR